MNPDDHITGTFEPNSPANQKELELTEMEVLQNELEDIKRDIKACKQLVKDMCEIDSSQKFYISGIDDETIEKYIEIRERLYYKIKFHL